MATYKKPYKADLFDLYVKWKALPSIYRGASAETLEKIGIDEPTVFELLSIKTQAQFAAQYDVDIGTLTDWNKRIDKENLLEPFRSSAFRKIVRNVFFSLAIKQAKEPTSAGTRLLAELSYGKYRPIEDPPKVTTVEEDAEKEKFQLIRQDIWDKAMRTLDLSYSEEALAETERLEKIDQARWFPESVTEPTVKEKKFELSEEVKEKIRRAKLDL